MTKPALPPATVVLMWTPEHSLKTSLARRATAATGHGQMEVNAFRENIDVLVIIGYVWLVCVNLVHLLVSTIKREA